MAKPAISEHSRQLAGEAGQRGWQYAPSGDHLGLAGRWNWHCRFEHPFELQAQSKPGLNRHHDRIGDLISGATPAGRPFWAFWHMLSDNVPHGGASWVRRSVAFIYTAAELPAVSVADRNRTGRAGTNPAQAILANIRESAERRTQKRPGDQAGHTSDWAVGSEEFQRRYRVRADDGRAAGWLTGPAIQQALLSRQPAISLTSTGADILAWTDYGWTRPGGVTDYRGECLTNVQDLDIVTVEALLDVLDIVPLPQ